MKKIVILILLMFPACCFQPCNAFLHNKKIELTDAQKVANKQIISLREDAFAFYIINDIENAYLKLESIPDEYKLEEDYLIMANILQDKEQPEEAIKFLNLAINKNPKFYKAYYNIGVIYLEQGKKEDAKTAFKKSVKLNKDFAYGYYNLGLCAYKDEKYKEAKSYYNRAILRKNDVPDFYYNLALAYKKLGDTKNAQKALNVYNELSKR